MSRTGRLELRPAEVKRAEELLVKARAGSPIGVRVTRTDVVHSALARGFDILALELARRAKSPRPFDAGAAAPGDDEPPPSSETRPRSPR